MTSSGGRRLRRAHRRAQRRLAREGVRHLQSRRALSGGSQLLQHDTTTRRRRNTNDGCLSARRGAGTIGWHVAAPHGGGAGSPAASEDATTTTTRGRPRRRPRRRSPPSMRTTDRAVRREGSFLPGPGGEAPAALVLSYQLLTCLMTPGALGEETRSTGVRNLVSVTVVSIPGIRRKRWDKEFATRSAVPHPFAFASRSGMAGNRRPSVRPLFIVG